MSHTAIPAPNTPETPTPTALAPVDPRQIGPVTTAASGGVAAAGILAWALETFANVQVPTDVQTYIGILFVITAGWAVKPRSKQVAA